MNVPILRDAASITSGQQVYLVDTPGLGDSNRSIAELAEKSVQTSPAYVYVMNYLNLQDESDSNAFVRMYRKDDSKFSFCKVVSSLPYHFMTTL